MTSVVVFDYGFGNVRSMVRALANLGLDTTLTSDYRQALEADGMVVPGVGAFAACMTGLREVSGDRVILDLCVPAAPCWACAWASRSCSSAATSTQTPPKDLD